MYMPATTTAHHIKARSYRALPGAAVSKAEITFSRLQSCLAYECSERKKIAVLGQTHSFAAPGQLLNAAVAPPGGVDANRRGLVLLIQTLRIF